MVLAAPFVFLITLVFFLKRNVVALIAARMQLKVSGQYLLKSQKPEMPAQNICTC